MRNIDKIAAFATPILIKTGEKGATEEFLKHIDNMTRACKQTYVITLCVFRGEDLRIMQERLDIEDPKEKVMQMTIYLDVDGLTEKDTHKYARAIFHADFKDMVKKQGYFYMVCPTSFVIATNAPTAPHAESGITVSLQNNNYTSPETVQRIMSDVFKYSQGEADVFTSILDKKGNFDITIDPAMTKAVVEILKVAGIKYKLSK